MKKLVTLFSVLILVLSLGTAALASTIGVNVGEGFSVSVENTDLNYDSFDIKANFGISGKTLLWLGYITECEDTDNTVPATTSFGARYEIKENFAGTFEYYTNDLFNLFSLGLRGKKILTKQLALVGEADYLYTDPDSGDSFSGYNLAGQIEYNINPLLTANLGLDYLDTGLEGGEAITSLIAGLEFYPTELITIWLDYRSPDNDQDDAIGAGLEFKF